MIRILAIALAVSLAGVAGTAQAAGDAAAGRAKAANCAMCHGAGGQGTQMGPRIAGMAPASFVAAMNNFKAGRGNNQMMINLARQLSDADIANLAAYYATLR
jgi:cytochrome c553